MNHVYNSSAKTPLTDRGVPYNPAFLHPDDLAELGVDDGGVVTIRTALGAIDAVAHPDPALRRGMVSMAFGYGQLGREADFREIGSSPNRLIATDEVFDPYTGQPRMSNVPVEVIPAVS